MGILNALFLQVCGSRGKALLEKAIRNNVSAFIRLFMWPDSKLSPTLRQG